MILDAEIAFPAFPAFPASRGNLPCPGPVPSGNVKLLVFSSPIADTDGPAEDRKEEKEENHPNRPSQRPANGLLAWLSTISSRFQPLPPAK